MANFVTLADAILAVAPAAAVFFAAYGRYDGTFRDNVVFLHFIGGLLVGGLLGVVSLFALGIAAPLVSVLVVALFYPITVVLGINRRKWQGDRHAVFNGGALGLGAAVMVSLSLLYRLTLLDMNAQAVTDLGIQKLADGTIAPSDQQAINAWVNQHFWTASTLGQSLLLAAAFAGLFFGLGLLAGDSVRRRKALPTALLGAAIVLPVAVFLEEYVASRALLWLALLVAYGATFAVLAERRLFIEGVSEEDRKALRRRRRAARE